MPWVASVPASPRPPGPRATSPPQTPRVHRRRARLAEPRRSADDADMIPSPAPPPSPPPLSLPASPAALVLALLVLLLPVVVMPSAAARADGPRWQWPVPPPHEVIAPFDAPATPYGPGHRGIDIAVLERTFTSQRFNTSNSSTST